MSYGKQLLEILASIEGGGSFAAFGTSQFILPGLFIEGFGEVSFPIMPEQAKSIIKEVAQMAPFGKGNQTIIDKKIRSAWEIDAAKISFANKEWKALLKNVLHEIKKELGLVDQKIEASLYKMLIYQKGDFFLPHKDSEKQVGMFGSLVIGLPSQHSGGQLIIRSGGKTKKVNFAAEQDGYRIPYAAFYTDCDHEIKPIRSGYRICLVYNLIQKNAISTDLSTQGYQRQVTMIANILNLAKEDNQKWPLALLLGHQYTPTNFCLGQLKHHDRSRAKILMDACEQSGFLSRLALVTHYQMGDLEGVDFYPSRWGKQLRTDMDVGTMGEIHEEYTEIKYWSRKGGPGLGELLLKGEEILSLFELGKNSPIEQEKEGFTGNAGMTIEYWYHYGAVIIWPEIIHDKILSDINLEAKIQWLSYYNQQLKKNPGKSIPVLEKLISEITQYDSSEDYWIRLLDFSPLADSFALINKSSLLEKYGIKILPKYFVQIRPKSWSNLLVQVDHKFIEKVFDKSVTNGEIQRISYLLEILKFLIKVAESSLSAFVKKVSNKIPLYLKNTLLYYVPDQDSPHLWKEDKKEHNEIARKVNKNILFINDDLNMSAKWQKDIIKINTQCLNRDYIFEVLTPVIFRRKGNPDNLVTAIVKKIILYLQSISQIEPQEPMNWSKPVPETKKNQKQWKILRPFLISETHQVLDYKANQVLRRDMQYAIRNSDIDLDMTTIKKGSPHILRLTKNKARYLRDLRDWNENLALLSKLRELIPDE